MAPKKNKSKSKSTKHRNRTLSEITVDSRAQRRHSKVLRLRYELEWISEFLRSPDRWLKHTELKRADADVRELVQALRKRKVALEKVLPRGENSTQFAQAFQRKARQDLPYAVRALDLHANLPLLIRSLLGANQQDDCPVFSIGQVQANDIRLYPWFLPTSPSQHSFAFWPLFQSNVFAQTTFTGDWRGSSGANFWGWIYVPPSLTLDLPDTFVVGIAFVFNIPPPECDSILSWGTDGIAEATTDWYVNARVGWAKTRWLVHESPAGGGFPASISNFETIRRGLLKHSSGATITRDVINFERSFEVKAGVSPSIFLGVELDLLAENGEVSTIKIGGLGDYFEFEHGITYIMETKIS